MIQSRHSPGRGGRVPSQRPGSRRRSPDPTLVQTGQAGLAESSRVPVATRNRSGGSVRRSRRLRSSYRTATAPDRLCSPPTRRPRSGMSSPTRASPGSPSSGPRICCTPRSRSSASPLIRSASPSTPGGGWSSGPWPGSPPTERLARDYERHPETSEAMIRGAAIADTARRITRGEPAQRQARHIFDWTGSAPPKKTRS